MDFAIEITVIAVVYIAFSTFAQRLIIDTKRVAELRQLIGQKNKELLELHKSGASEEAKKAKADELKGHTAESMRHGLKPLIIALPLFLVVYYLIFPAVFTTPQQVTVFSYTMDYRVYFIYVSIVVGIVLQIFLQRYDTSKLKKSQQAAQTAAQ